MKKVILVVMAVMLASMLLTAAAPPLKIMRLEIINKSGNVIYLRLEGSDVGQQFYYLTIPLGTKEMPTVKTFTVLSDVYSRTTYYGAGDPIKEGISSTGKLIVDRNTRLNFLPGPSIRPYRYDVVTGGWTTMFGGCIEGPHGHFRACGHVDYWDPLETTTIYKAKANWGEPSMEKVLYIKWLDLDQATINSLDWDDVERWYEEGPWVWYYWRVKTEDHPDLVQWRYRY